MKLNDLVNRIPHTGASDTDITAITYDSRKACAGSLFVCLVGAWLDGHTYAASAYQNGCLFGGAHTRPARRCCANRH